MSENYNIIGIDCSTNPRKLGLALGIFNGDKLGIREVRVGEREPLATLTGWLSAHSKNLIAIDAPLGWPIAMGTTLAAHRAGDRIAVASHQMFRRHTDRVIKRLLGKQSLGVGANLIARTALFAVNLLAQMRESADQPIPMAWNPDFDARSYGVRVKCQSQVTFTAGLPGSRAHDQLLNAATLGKGKGIIEQFLL